MRFKKLIFLILIIALLLTICVPVIAADSNVDVDKILVDANDTDSDTDVFLSGRGGFRVYIMDKGGNRVGKVVDFSMNSLADRMLYTTTSNNTKYDYKKGGSPSFSLKSGNYFKIANDMPSPWTGTLGEYKSYFGDRGVIEKVILPSVGAGISVEQLSGEEGEGGYEIIFEPIFVFKYNGTLCAMTPTEIAIQDEKFGGGIKKVLGSVSHKLAPLSAFFADRDHFGVGVPPAYSGGMLSNSIIVSYYGIGAVVFDMQEPPKNDLSIDLTILENQQTRSWDISNISNPPSPFFQSSTFDVSKKLAWRKSMDEPLVGPGVPGGTTQKECPGGFPCLKTECRSNPIGTRRVESPIYGENGEIVDYNVYYETIYGKCKGFGQCKEIKCTARHITSYSIVRTHVSKMSYLDPRVLSSANAFQAVRNVGAWPNPLEFYKYAKNSAYTHPNGGTGIFYEDGLTPASFMGHRGGVNQYKDRTLKNDLSLAGYMKNTPENIAYKNLFKDKCGYREEYDIQTGNMDGGIYTFQAVHYATDEDPELSLGDVDIRYCDGSKDHFAGQMGNISTSTAKVVVKVEPTVKVQSKSVSADSLKAQIYTNNYNFNNYDNPHYLTIAVPSNRIGFAPTFQMDYANNYSQLDPQNKVWILSDKTRTFQALDLFSISTKPIDTSKTEMTGPWSRDAVDRLSANHSDDVNNRGEGVNTIKAGQVLDYTTKGLRLSIDWMVHLQDPSFVDPSSKSKVEEANKAKIKEFVEATNAVIESYTYQPDQPVQGIGIYTNLWQGNSEGSYTLENYFGGDDLNRVPTSQTTYEKVNKKVDPPSQAEKTRFKVMGGYNTTYSNYPTFKAYIVDADGDGHLNVPSRPPLDTGYSDIPYTLVGVYPYAMSYQVGGMNSHTDVVEQLLYSGLGKNGWYSEEYEGIIVLTFHCELKIDKIETKSAQIHTHLSDFRTSRNELASTLYLPISKMMTSNFKYNKLIPGVEVTKPSEIATDNGFGIEMDVLTKKGPLFGVGVEFQVTKKFTLGGIAFGRGTKLPIAVFYRPYLFSVKDSVFSTAQY